VQLTYPAPAWSYQRSGRQYAIPAVPVMVSVPPIRPPYQFSPATNDDRPC